MLLLHNRVTSVLYVHKDASTVWCTAVIAKALLQDLLHTEGQGTLQGKVVTFWSVSSGREYTPVGVV